MPACSGCYSIGVVSLAAAVATVATATDANPAADTNPRQFQDWGKLPSAAVMAMAESRVVQPSKNGKAGFMATEFWHS